MNTCTLRPLITRGLWAELPSWRPALPGARPELSLRTNVRRASMLPAMWIPVARPPSTAGIMPFVPYLARLLPHPARCQFGRSQGTPLTRLDHPHERACRRVGSALVQATVIAAAVMAGSVVPRTNLVAQATAPMRSPAGVRDTASQVLCGPGLSPDSTAAGDLPVCRGTIARIGQTQRFQIRLQLTQAPLKGRKVVFKADAGALIQDTVESDSLGVVQTGWYRHGGAKPVGIAVGIPVGSGSVLQYIQLSLADTTVMLETAQTPQRQLYVNATSRPVILEISTRHDTTKTPITNPAICSQLKVVFLARGAGATPTADTTSGEVYGARPLGSEKPLEKGCFVQTSWRMGSQAGAQELRVTGIDTTGYRFMERLIPFEATARRTPQFVLGATFNVQRRYQTAVKGTAPAIKVERTLHNGKITYDSVASTSVEAVQATVGALVGVTVPIPGWKRIALAIGADVTDPARAQFAGISLQELLGGMLPQGFPLDVLVLGARQRSEVLENPVACEAGSLPDPCKTRTRHQLGGSLALTIDAGTLVSEVIKKLSK